MLICLPIGYSSNDNLSRNINMRDIAMTSTSYNDIFFMLCNHIFSIPSNNASFILSNNVFFILYNNVSLMSFNFSIQLKMALYRDNNFDNMDMSTFYILVKIAFAQKKDDDNLAEIL